MVIAIGTLFVYVDELALRCVICHKSWDHPHFEAINVCKIGNDMCFSFKLLQNVFRAFA